MSSFDIYTPVVIIKRVMRERYLINSILRAGGILKTFAEGKGSFTLREMAQFMKLDRSTTYRILLSLEKCGLVEKDEKAGAYSLGLGAFEIGSAYQRRADFVPIAKPFMEELALKAQETVNLAVLSGTEILYLDKVDSPRSVGVMSKIGQRNPVYCTSLGKSLLAFQSEEEQARIMAAIEFKPLTPHTITSRKEFLEGNEPDPVAGLRPGPPGNRRRRGMHRGAHPKPPGQRGRRHQHLRAAEKDSNPPGKRVCRLGYGSRGGYIFPVRVQEGR